MQYDGDISYVLMFNTTKFLRKLKLFNSVMTSKSFQVLLINEFVFAVLPVTEKLQILLPIWNVKDTF